MSCFKEQLAGYVELTERELDRYLSLDAEVPEELAKAMAYSLQAGGKRLRPALVINACEIMGGTPKDALPYACALEMIHTYSLIHDDLPALDNDNLRRGKPTSHVVFGEAKAILTGDALLSYAFEIMLNAACDSNGIRACRHIARAAGIRGMVGGQWEDVSNEGKAISSHMLRYIHEHKTADMITGGLMAGGAAAGAEESELSGLKAYGLNIGLAFQITDDILDVTGSQEEMGKSLGKDAEEKKATYVALFGVDKAYQAAREHINAAKDALAAYNNIHFLVQLADFILTRRS